MKHENVEALPVEAFARGIGKLRQRKPAQNVVVLGFDTEYDSHTQEIICYQLSDGKTEHSAIIERQTDFKWEELADWVRSCLIKWGYKLRELNTIMLVSHFSSAELSHIDDFWKEAEVRRVSAAQVYNASYRINQHTRLVVMDNYHFWNTGNNGNASLAKVAEKFGETKLDYDTSNVTRDSLKDPVFVEYALWDAIVCARVFKKFRKRLWDDWQIDVIQYPTSASLAMAVYRQHFLPESFEAPDAPIRRQAWHSLWGGRAEAYVQGDLKEPHTLRDVESLYPTSQRILHKLPRKQDWIIRDYPKTWRGLCRVKFSFPKSVRYPCLPVCHDGKLIHFKEGISDCTLDEAKLAHKLGAELDFIKVFEYEDGDDSLTRFMEHFAKQKADCSEEGVWKEGKWIPCNHKSSCDCDMKDAVGRELAKLMMNSLIGKLSQNRGDVDIEDLKTYSQKIGVPLEIVMSPAFVDPEKPKANPRIGGHIMPEWSALILGKARAIMGAMLNDVQESKICSTDSLLVPDRLNALVDEIMVQYGVNLTDKNHGKTSNKIRIVRNRVYAATDEKDEIIFGASHAIHLGRRRKDCDDCKKSTCKNPLHDALRFILSDHTSYTKTTRFGLKTAIRMTQRFFGDNGESEMRFDRLWDEKRRLLPDGSTVPWLNVEEYDSSLAVSKELRRKTPKPVTRK